MYLVTIMTMFAHVTYQLKLMKSNNMFFSSYEDQGVAGVRWTVRLFQPSHGQQLDLVGVFPYQGQLEPSGEADATGQQRESPL